MGPGPGLGPGLAGWAKSYWRRDCLLDLLLDPNKVPVEEHKRGVIKIKMIDKSDIGSIGSSHLLMACSLEVMHNGYIGDGQHQPETAVHSCHDETVDSALTSKQLMLE